MTAQVGAPAVFVVAAAEAEPAKGFPFSGPYVVMAVLLVAIVALWFLKRAGRVARRPEPGASPERRPRGEQDPGVARLYLELNEFAREVEGRMDTKITYLRRLIAEAEKVLGDLNGAVERAETLKGVPADSTTADEAGWTAPAEAGQPPGEAAGPPDPAPPAGAGSRPQPVIDVVIGGPGPLEKERLKERILSLSGSGKTKEAIAEAVGIPKGEVELVLSLHRASQQGLARNGGRDREGEELIG